MERPDEPRPVVTSISTAAPPACTDAGALFPLDQVEQIPDDRNSTLYLLSEPIFDPLRGSPRFQRVLDRLGLGEAARLAASVSTR